MKISNKKGTILISEDNYSNMKLLKDILEFQEYEVIEAYDGNAALSKINSNSDKIDLILMDLQLPEIDGFEVIKTVKSNNNTKNLPIIVISAHAMESDIQKAINAGCCDYITKPINITTFIHKINSILKSN